MTQTYDTDHYYYINRGLPIAWAGVSAQDKIVDFPLIKAPFIVKESGWYLPEKYSPSFWSKIINLKVFLPLIATLFLTTYLVVMTCVKFFNKSKRLKLYLNILMAILILPCIFFYFFWFPRI